METECGIVRKVTGKYVLVEADAVSFCASCDNHECTMRQSRGRQLLIENTMGAKSGDRVFFVIPSKGLVLTSVVLYGIPIMFLIAGIITGMLVQWPCMNADTSGIVTGMAFLAFSFAIMRIATKYITRHNTLNPQMVKVEKLL